MNEAQNFFNKLSDWSGHPKKRLKKSTIQCLKDLCIYLDSLCKEHVKKSYSNDYLIGVVFKGDAFFNTEAEFNQYCKCQIVLANLWLKSLVETISQGGVTHYKILKYKDYLNDFLFDLKSFVEYLERKKNKSYSFFHGGKYYGQQSWQVFREAGVLYWTSSIEKSLISHRSAINLSVFTLRQSLELKFRNLLGLSHVHNIKFNQPKIRHDYFPEFIENNLSLFETNYRSIREIITIYKWTNSTIHTGVMPYIWEPIFAVDYCSKLFVPDGVSSNGAWSRYSAVKIKDYETLRTNFAKSFYNEFPKDIWCFHFVEPEAVVL